MQRYYHGEHRKGPYFEGWYLRFVTRDGTALAVIPAWHQDAAGERTASLQIITGQGSWWVDVPIAQFRASSQRFHVQMGQNRFTEQGVSLQIHTDGLDLQGCLRYGPLHPLPGDIMGPFSLLGNLECAHGIISMCHPLEGTLICNGQKLDFSGGMGYLETDRGRSFPQEYLWSQCAWRAFGQNSVMLAVAKIPIGKWSFPGCICAILYEGRFYRLATYYGAKIEKWSCQGAALHQGKYRLEVDLLQPHAQDLRAPNSGRMERKVLESVDAMVRYRFWCDGRLLFERNDPCAGFEYGRTKE